MKMKKLTALFLSALMAISTLGCSAVSIDGTSPASSDSANSESSGNNESGSIGLSISTMNNPFFVTLSEGADAKAKELGMNLITVDAGDDSAKQASDIEDLVSKGIKVLIVNPVDSDAVAPAVETAISKGIKVVSVDRVVNGVDEQEVKAHAVKALELVGVHRAVQGDAALLAQHRHIAQQDVQHVAARMHRGGIAVHRLTDLVQAGQLHLLLLRQGLGVGQHVLDVVGGDADLLHVVLPLLVLLLGVGQQPPHDKGLGSLLLPAGDIHLDDEGEHAADDGVDAHGGLILDALPGVVSHQAVDADAQHRDGGGQQVQMAATAAGADVPGKHHIDDAVDRRKHQDLQGDAQGGDPAQHPVHRRDEPGEQRCLVGDVLGGEPGHAGGGHGGGVPLKAIHRAQHPPGHQQEIPQKPGRAGRLGDAGGRPRHEHQRYPRPGKRPPAFPRLEIRQEEPLGKEDLKQIGEGLQMGEQRLEGESHGRSAPQILVEAD